MDVLSIRRPVPIIFTNEVRDRVCMVCEIQTLYDSRIKGKCKDPLQWDSMRRNPTRYNNAREVVEGSYDTRSIYSSNQRKVYASTATMESRCFSIFILRTKHRVRVLRYQDKTLTVDQILLIGDISENEWVQSNSEEEKKELEFTISFATIAFCVSLRGGEAPLIIIVGLNMFLKDNKNHRIPHMMMTIKEIFKVKNNLLCHCVPLSGQTKSRITTRSRISWMLYHRCKLENQKRFFLFARYNRKKLIIREYNPMLRNLLDEGRKCDLSC